MNRTHVPREGSDLDARSTALVRRRYDRIARVYELLDRLGARWGATWRRDLWGRVEGTDILEVGVGTGFSMPFYPRGASITAVDISPKMLERARSRASRLRLSVELALGDVQNLTYPAQSFDSAAAMFVFCSVPDPICGLREILRVLKPDGRLVLIEHVLSLRWWLRPIMQGMDPLSSRIFGAHMNRDTVANVRAAGFADVASTNLAFDVVKRIEARRPPATSRRPSG